jgi:hypothetical protein
MLVLIFLNITHIYESYYLIPPIILLARNIMNTLDIDHVTYDIKVPSFLIKKKFLTIK